jgi:hypothetical protein
MKQFAEQQWNGRIESHDIMGWAKCSAEWELRAEKQTALLRELRAALSASYELSPEGREYLKKMDAVIDA